MTVFWMHEVPVGDPDVTIQDGILAVAHCKFSSTVQKGQLICY